MMYETFEEATVDLKQKFPDGLLVTVVANNEAIADVDESPQYFAEEVRCIKIENNVATVSINLFGSDRDILAEIDDFEARDYGLYALTTETTVPDYMLSKNITDQQREWIKSARAERESE